MFICILLFVVILLLSSLIELFDKIFLRILSDFILSDITFLILHYIILSYFILYYLIFLSQKVGGNAARVPIFLYRFSVAFLLLIISFHIQQHVFQKVETPSHFPLYTK